MAKFDKVNTPGKVHAVLKKLGATNPDVAASLDEVLDEFIQREEFTNRKALGCALNRYAVTGSIRRVGKPRAYLYYISLGNKPAATRRQELIPKPAYGSAYQTVKGIRASLAEIDKALNNLELQLEELEEVKKVMEVLRTLT